MLQTKLTDAPKKFSILRVGTWPAALDIMDAKAIKLPGDLQLILRGERHALALSAIT